MHESDPNFMRWHPIHARYIELVLFLGEQRDFAYGWKSEASDLLGISPSHLTRLLTHDRIAGRELAERAAEACSFDVSYFWQRLPFKAWSGGLL